MLPSEAITYEKQRAGENTVFLQWQRLFTKLHTSRCHLLSRWWRCTLSATHGRERWLRLTCDRLSHPHSSVFTPSGTPQPASFAARGEKHPEKLSTAAAGGITQTSWSLTQGTSESTPKIELEHLKTKNTGLLRLIFTKYKF